ncbi:Sec-independent protein translocase protein TatB [Aeromonas schubertii]|uniref:Sec-independent protein translocase protein TatB n=1 Tax=Aeromonas schubertii TaxID=652 RepID=UPI0010A8D0F2|nr:Sec-independent protein translocase protein TatB [Aeromonas schubertii]QCG46581.1 Sec-independent protein translocase subunit TatB [Aeromonas schubertii]
MFDIGFWELIVIAVVALVVLGPERLPEAVRTLAKWVKLVRNTANAVKMELSEELRIQELHNDLKKAEKLNMQNLSPDLQASIEELKVAAASVNRPYAKDEAITSTEAQVGDGAPEPSIAPPVIEQKKQEEVKP